MRKKNALKEITKPQDVKEEKSIEIPFNTLNLEVKQSHDVPIKVYRLYNDVNFPFYATEGSSCFDLSAYMSSEILYVDTYNRLCIHGIRTITSLIERDGVRGIYLEPGECAFIPTGIIFDIPSGYRIEIYPRSGLSAKKHIKLANPPAIIDEDYVHQTMVLVFNDSASRQTICHEDRIAQGAIVPAYKAKFLDIEEAPAQKTQRAGGFGSTKGYKL